MRMLRFKRDDGTEYPEWKATTLESIGTFYGGLSGKTKEDFSKGDGKFVTYMNVYKNTFTNHEMLESVDVTSDEHQNTVSYGDILMTQSSETVEEVGLSSVYLFHDKPYLNSFCFGLRLNDQNETKPEYMGYLMRSESVRKQIMKEGQGISRINLSPNRIRALKLSIPHPDEQQKIADCLSSVDAVIADYEAQVENMQNQKKGVMQKLFSQEVRFKKDDGSDYPEWSTDKVSELFDISAGGDIDRENSSPIQSDAFPYAVYANALTDNGLHSYANYYKVDKDCFTVTGRGDVGHAIARHEKFVPIVRLLVCTPKHEENVDCFAALINNTHIFLESTGVPQLTAPQFGKIKVNHPVSEEEQSKIADCLAAFDTALEDLQEIVEHWKNIKKGLLQQLFT